MKRIFLLLLAAAPLAFGFALKSQHDNSLTCPQPSNVAVTYQSGGDIAFDWNDCEGGCSGYGVQYWRRNDSYLSQKYLVSNSSISFSNLPGGTYEFYFTTVCGSTSSGAIIIEEVISN